MDQFTRRIIGFGVHAGVVDGPAVCRMFNSAIRGGGTPRYLSSDHDPLFEFRRFKANLRILEVTEVKTVPYAPLSHPFVERLIGTIRREFLDQVPFWTACDLERKLLSFRDYYNDQRSHHALGGVTLCTVIMTGSCGASPIGEQVRWVDTAELLAGTGDIEHPVYPRAFIISALLPARNLAD